METIVENSVVSILLFVLNEKKQLVSNSDDLVSIKIKIMEELKEIYGEYLFFQDIPYFETVSLKSTNILTEGRLLYYLQAEVDVSDCIEDEWMIAFSLYKLSQKHPNFIIHLTDSDGDYLLIEAAKVLPNWMDPDTMENRFFLKEGHFIYIPHPSYSSFTSIPISLSIEDSLHCIQQHQYCIEEAIEEAIHSHFTSLSSLFSNNTHSCNCILPSSWSSLLYHHPSICCLFAQVYLQASEIEKEQSEKAFNSLPTTNQMQQYTIQLPRLLFIQLIITSPSSKQRDIRGIDEYLALSLEQRAKLIGQRLYYGALLLPPSKQTKSINEEDMKKFSSTLSSELTYALLNNYSYQEYCQLERSLIPQWLEEKEEKKSSEWIYEDLSWLQISEEELKDVLNNEEANLRDEDIAAIINEDEVGNKVLSSFKSFIASVSNVEGIDSIPKSGEKNERKPVDVDFDRVVDLLKGMNIVVSDEEDEDDDMFETVKEVKKQSNESNESNEFNESSESNDDMDLDVLTNLLQSYTSQPSMDGPVQNILTSMGMAIPPSKEK